MDDKFATQLLQELAPTQYACTSLEPFSTRQGNHVFRGKLEKKIRVSDEIEAESIIIKYTAPTIDLLGGPAAEDKRQAFDQSFAKAIGNMQPPDRNNGITIRAPKIYEWNEASSIQLQEDLTDTGGLIFMLTGPSSEKLFGEPSGKSVGYYIGSWLRAFHSWADAPQQASLRALLPLDDPMREVKCRFTFDNFIGVLEQFPAIMKGHEEVLLSIRDAMVSEFGKTHNEDGWGIVHGDLWGGNILAPISGWRTMASLDDPNKLFVIDWEMAQFGHRSYDLGQVLGDLYEKRVFRNNHAVTPVMESVIIGYGAVSKDMALRTAIYVGIHLITWYQRRPKKGIAATIERDVIEKGLAMGRDYILKGWEKDTQFFKDTDLSLLFA